MPACSGLGFVAFFAGFTVVGLVGFVERAFGRSAGLVRDVLSLAAGRGFFSGPPRVG